MSDDEIRAHNRRQARREIEQRFAVVIDELEQAEGDVDDDGLALTFAKLRDRVRVVRDEALRRFEARS